MEVLRDLGMRGFGYQRYDETDSQAGSVNYPSAPIPHSLTGVVIYNADILNLISSMALRRTME